MNQETYQQALAPGYQLLEYQIETKLGEGGFGITYRALDTNLQKRVAIKEYLPTMFAVRTGANTVLPKSETDQDDFEWGLNSFIEEARVLAKFAHPNLNGVLRYFNANNTAYMVLDYIDGVMLADQIDKGLAFTENTILKLLDQLTNGLTVVHEAGVIHRDIKPSNIMIRENGDAVLLDFGAARQTIGAKTRDITTILTPGYAPFEQYSMDSKKIKAYTDIYALGMVMYRCMTGCRDSEIINANARIGELVRNPPGDDPLPALADKAREHYSQSLLDTIQSCIHPFEDRRPQTIAELRERLFSATDHAQPTRVLPPSNKNNDATRVIKPAASQNVAGSSDKPKSKLGLWLGLGFALVIIAGFVFVSLPKSEKTFDLNITILPKDAKIMLSGNGEELTYKDGMSLKPGSYTVKSSANGYQSLTQPLEIKDSDVVLNINLKKTADNDQDEFVKGLNITASVNKKRLDHIQASMGLYVFKHKKFLECVKTQCAELGKLRNSIVSLKDTKWNKDGFSGRLVIESGSRTKAADCQMKLAVQESITHAGQRRAQNRTYCTNSGVNFKLLSAGEIIR